MEERVRSFFSEYGIICILAVAGVVFLAFGILHLNSQPQSSLIVSNTPDTQEQELLVDVGGAVKKPGLYSLVSGNRIADAITKAGGITDEADTEYVYKVLNQAEKVKDGQKIFIPVRSVEGANNSSSVAQSSAQSSLININTASASELDTLPGIGAVTAEKIITNRPYSAVEELRDKKVVNSSVFEKIKDSITLF
jgi:competence protein ComEA